MSISSRRTGNLSANVTAYGDLNLAAGGTLTLSGQSLAGGNATLNAGTINLGTLVSGVEFAATEQSGGLPILKTGDPATGQMSLTATGGATTAIGSITADQLLSAVISMPSWARSASTGIRLQRATSHLRCKALISADRSRLATAGTLIVNAASANLANSTLTFGGIALNLSGGVDASGTKLRAVTADGGNGDIIIAATTITTTAATALLAANDLTLTLASLTNAGQLAANNNLTFSIR
ncbi:MAG: hypothetical protein ACTHLK_16450 [Brucella intermedia]